MRTAQMGAPRGRQAGIALVTALGTMTVVLALLLLVSALVIRSSWVTANDADATRLALLADGHSERARLLLVESYRRSGVGLSTWLDFVNPDRGSVPARLTPPTADEAVMLAGVHETRQGDATLRWRVTEVSPPDGTDAWVRVAATASDARGTQTVTRKVAFGENNMFNFALLTESTDCMFCHLQVRGDVGSLNFFRPGSSAEGDEGSRGVGRGSRVTGDVIGARGVTDDDRGGGRVNGARVEGSVISNYTGQRLPRDTDGDGRSDFPGLDGDLARRSANGGLSGGRLQGVPLGGRVSDVQSGGRLAGATELSSVSKVYEGNLVLIGTPDDPIRLDRDVYVSGDVVIRGVVTGRGAIYAGRNLYLAGDVVNARRADPPGRGICATAEDPDECARINIAAGRDEVRLAATNNIVLGTFGERRDGGGMQARVDRQAADFMRHQFGLKPGATFYVRKGTSEEVRRRDDGSFVSSTGRPVPAGAVQAVPGDPYHTLMAPGTTDAGGTFRPWLGDEQYDALLGTEDVPYGTWRTEVNLAEVTGTRDPYDTAGWDPEDVAFWRRVAAIEDELSASGLPVDYPEEWCPQQACGWNWSRDVAYHLANNKPREIEYRGRDRDGRPVSGQVKITPSSDGRPTLHVAVTDARPYKREATRVDAFLYANARIGGKLGNRGGHINGGLIARQIGILAPGKGEHNDHFTNLLRREDREGFRSCAPGTADSTEDMHVMADGACAYSINYDHRLRNGGYGFNLIRGVMGGTTEWRLDPTGESAVRR